ncbi:hypothetical protein [Streptomyces xanthophaeus]|uniref:hypothetical protein n=1 Tax=Streptomyces xanthophaeus TaxID=67385 RepID=UPI0036510C18
MSDTAQTQKQALVCKVQILGGLWDTARGMTVLRDAGYEPGEKHVRRVYRGLARTGVLVKVQDRPVQYRVNEPGQQAE